MITSVQMNAMLDALEDIKNTSSTDPDFLIKIQTLRDMIIEEANCIQNLQYELMAVKRAGRA